MEHYESQELDREYRDICIPALIGGIIGFLSPLALVKSYFWAIPVLSLAFVAWGLCWIMMTPHRFTGGKLAMWGAGLSLFFGTAAVVDSWVYYQMDLRSGRIFAGQWFELMMEGRDKEACQLGMNSLLRVSGRGIEMSFATNPLFIEAYSTFHDNPQVRTILREFQGGTAKYIRLVKTYQQKKRWSYVFEYELSVGEGYMKKTRLFRLTAECFTVDGEKRYEWKWLRVAGENEKD